MLSWQRKSEAWTTSRNSSPYCASASPASTASGPPSRPRPPPAGPTPRNAGPPAGSSKSLMSGEVVRTAHGEHFETEKLWERHRRHGSMDISSLAELPDDLLDPLSDGAIPRCAPGQLGLPRYRDHGSGGRHRHLRVSDRRGPHRRRRVSACASSSCAITARRPRCWRASPSTWRSSTSSSPTTARPTTSRCSKRATAWRARATPSSRMEHLDLLFGARRLWKLRLESCRLVDLENQILGVERQGDLPGEMIPYYYFEYLRTQQAFRLVPDLPPQRHRHSLAGLPDGHRAVRLPLARGRRRPARRRPDRPGPLAARRPSARTKPCGCSAAPWTWGCPTTCSSARCGTSPRSKRAPGPRGRRAGRANRPGRLAAIPTACARSRSWPSTTSTASATTPWRSR